jgi:hypothetical protein
MKKKKKKNDKKFKNNYKNSLTFDSIKHQRTFVIRGDSVGVFIRDENCNQPIYDTQIDNLKDLNNKEFVPYKGMLHNQDSDLLFIHKDVNQEQQFGSQVYRMDLDRGEIVETWNTYEDYVPIHELKPHEKYADQTPSKVFGGLNEKTLFAMDPRIQTKSKLVGNVNDITARKNPYYSCFATSLDGFVVVGSNTGEIRMFTGLPNLSKSNGKKGNYPKRAKTLLPGYGDPIIGIDITNDGSWIVATCKNYLLIINTEIENSNQTGFEKPMGKNKPTPKMLKLLPEQMMEMQLKNTSFTPAKFNTGGNGELWIVTSRGSFVITWNFRRVQLNHLYDYTMKRVSNKENVVIDQFQSVKMDEDGTNVPIIVTTPNDLLMEKKQKTKKIPYSSRRETKYN